MRCAWLGLAIVIAGCAEEEMAVRTVEPVQLAQRDPEGCVALPPIELRTTPENAPTAERLRDEAADRGANYLVVDTFRLLDDEASLLTRGRPYRCPTADSR